MLPPQIHLLTLEKWKNGDLLLRLEHIYQKDEHPELSKPATVNLQVLKLASLIQNLQKKLHENVHLKICHLEPVLNIQHHKCQ